MSNKSKSNVIIMKKEYLYFIDLVKITPMISVTLAKHMFDVSRKVRATSIPT